jgi:nitroreductase
MSKSTLEDLKARRSVRAYKGEQIKKDELDAILEAGTWAASGMGRQPAVIVAVQNQAVIEKIQKLNADVLNDPSAKPFYGAPTVVNVLVDTTKAATPVEDGNLVIGNLLNAAAALGIASCYVYRAKEVFESEGGKALLKEWGLATGYVAVGHVLLGYGAESPKPAPRKEEFIIKIV